MLGVYIDIETSGLDPARHVPLDIAAVVVDLATGDRLAECGGLIACSPDEWAAAAATSLQFHGITWEEVVHAPTRQEMGQKLLECFKPLRVQRGQAVFIGQNPSFDRYFFAKLIPVVQQEENSLPYHWLDLASMFWAHVQWARSSHAELKFTGLSKDQIADSLGLPPEAEPHRASGGVAHLLDCYARLVGWPDKLEAGSGTL